MSDDTEAQWCKRAAETAGSVPVGQAELFETPGQADLFAADGCERCGTPADLDIAGLCDDCTAYNDSRVVI